MTQRRALLAEDSLLILIGLEMLLEQYEIGLVGPASTLAEALALTRQGGFDIAILDINLHNEPSYPVADLLVERGIPFIFTTGYNTDMLPARFAGVASLQKPYESDALMALVEQAFCKLDLQDKADSR